LLIFGYSPLYLPTNKEATARININQLLEDAGWQFFDDENGPAKIITRSKILMDEMGN
jgi:type I restriction enzyme, R subunit